MRMSFPFLFILSNSTVCSFLIWLFWINFQDPRLKEMEKILDCEERVVDDDSEGSSSGEKQKHYLVKWKGLSYIHCSWSVFHIILPS